MTPEIETLRRTNDGLQRQLGSVREKAANIERELEETKETAGRRCDDLQTLVAKLSSANSLLKEELIAAHRHIGDLERVRMEWYPERAGGGEGEASASYPEAPTLADEGVMGDGAGEDAEMTSPGQLNSPPASPAEPADGLPPAAEGESANTKRSGAGSNGGDIKASRRAKPRTGGRNRKRTKEKAGQEASSDDTEIPQLVVEILNSIPKGDDAAWHAVPTSCNLKEMRDDFYKASGLCDVINALRKESERHKWKSVLSSFIAYSLHIVGEAAKEGWNCTYRKHFLIFCKVIHGLIKQLFHRELWKGCEGQLMLFLCKFSAVDS